MTDRQKGWIFQPGNCWRGMGDVRAEVYVHPVEKSRGCSLYHTYTQRRRFVFFLLLFTTSFFFVLSFLCLDEIDSSYRPPAPTAQNARQEGKYLAKVFNAYPTPEDKLHAPSFKETWNGSLAYVGKTKESILISLSLPIFNLSIHLSIYLEKSEDEIYVFVYFFIHSLDSSKAAVVQYDLFRHSRQFEIHSGLQDACTD